MDNLDILGVGLIKDYLNSKNYCIVILRLCRLSNGNLRWYFTDDSAYSMLTDTLPSYNDIREGYNQAKAKSKELNLLFIGYRNSVVDIVEDDDHGYPFYSMEFLT